MKIMPNEAYAKEELYQNTGDRINHLNVESPVYVAYPLYFHVRSISRDRISQ